ncbi:hypothetical protein HRR77_000910 [Exophiala dermatitidis]|nr:hypothetical protein HRR77_000910 [Exophiala dermatitidis]
MIRASSEGPGSSAPTPKFLRYRSLRKSASAVKNPEPEPAPPLPPVPPTSKTSITRLPSRYHRKPKPETSSLSIPQNAGACDDGASARPEPAPEVSQSDKQEESQQSRGRKMVTERAERSDTARNLGRDLAAQEDAPGADSTEAPCLRRSYEVAREEARLILEGEVDRLRELREREARRRLEERQRRKEKGRARADDGGQRTLEDRDKSSSANERHPEVGRRHDLSADKNSPETSANRRTTPDGAGSKTRTLVIGGPPLLRKAKHHSHGSSGASEPHRSSSRGHHTSNSVERMKELGGAMPIPLPPSNIPNFDAPVSAVNAGARRVQVQFKTESITIPVTPSTTCKDILKSASLSMSESVDPGTAILAESFSQLGLERPLRKYERVRDVMNSWDDDKQHHLYIADQREFHAAGDLGVGDAPKQQPSGVSVHIYHSHKPGRWDKRWVKLRGDGQVTVSKNEHGLDATNICHLSDFDLYTPTTRQMKKLKPPKKLCFALKSQEKSSMFLSGANFVHFFCTKDKTLADQWYQAVHSWRSWYLVNVLGEGLTSPTAAAGIGVGRQQSTKRPSTSYSKDSSSSPRHKGSFKPLLSFGSSRPSMDGERERIRAGRSHSLRRSQDTSIPRPLIESVPDNQHTAASGSRPGSPIFHPPKTSQSCPPTAFPRNLIPSSSHTVAAADDADTGPFTGTGLLARSASRRSQGGSRSGHGVHGVDGKPLVDLHPTSEFTDGSLLRKMEAIIAQQDALHPKIDREKRREVDVSVGEGYD